MIEAIDRHVGRRLRMHRRLKDLTQAELAQQVGVSFQQIQKYEVAAQRMSVAMLCKLADALEIEPHHLLSGPDKKLVDA